MKYIKLFEDLNSKLYRKISLEEKNEFRDGRRNLRIPYLIVNKLERYVDGYLWDYCKKFSGTKPYRLYGCEDIEGYDLGFSYIKLEPMIRSSIDPVVFVTHYDDDYYLATHSFQIGRSSHSTHYLCDQIEGLMEFIKDLSNGKI